MINDIAQLRFDGDAENCVAAISGEIDTSNTQEIREMLDERAADASCLIVDLTETSFLDSAGVALLLDIAGRLRVTRRQFHVVIPEDAPIRRVVELSGLDGQIDIVATRAELLDATN
jgi:anti-anti-sigma factor